MLRSLPESIQLKFQPEFEAILASLGQDSKVLGYKEEVLATWYASTFIKRVCISQVTWLQELLENDALNINYHAENYIEVLKPVFSAASNIEELQQLLRRVRAAEFARIAWRDLQHYANGTTNSIRAQYFCQSLY